MELINEVPPIKVDGRIVACEGGGSDICTPRPHAIASKSLMDSPLRIDIFSLQTATPRLDTQLSSFA